VAQAAQQTAAEVTVIDVAKQQQQQQEQQDQEKQKQLEAQAEQAASDLAVVMSDALSKGLAEVERDGTMVIVRLAEKGTFGPGDAKLNPSAIPTIRAMQEMIDQNLGTVRVSGHTDNRGIAAGSDFHSNWDLSSVRAAAVADTLRTILGVNTERLTVEGLADSQPLNDNATAAERARNRRVEIILDMAE
jgi:chemotaxis protein MotB